MAANPPESFPYEYPQAGDVIDGKYRVEQLLGAGGMGAVARATHLLRRAPVALKFLSPAVLPIPGAVNRFLNEGVAASQINSEHVVRIYDVGTLPGGAPYLVMECLTGRDLDQILTVEGQRGLQIERALHITIQILRGVQVAHGAGIIHRDLKPANCYVVEHEGEAEFIKLLDFGISKVQREGELSLTQTNSVMGTPLYMSPEQGRNMKDVDLRTDLYSVGAMLFEMLTGRTPFVSETGQLSEILYKLFMEDVPSVRALRPEVPEGLEAALMRALARNREERFGSAFEMAEAISPFLSQASLVYLQRIRSGPVRGASPSGLLSGGYSPLPSATPGSAAIASVAPQPSGLPPTQSPHAPYPAVQGSVPPPRLPSPPPSAAAYAQSGPAPRTGGSTQTSFAHTGPQAGKRSGVFIFATLALAIAGSAGWYLWSRLSNGSEPSVATPSAAPSQPTVPVATAAPPAIDTAAPPASATPTALPASTPSTTAAPRVPRPAPLPSAPKRRSDLDFGPH